MSRQGIFTTAGRLLTLFCRGSYLWMSPPYPAARGESAGPSILSNMTTFFPLVHILSSSFSRTPGDGLETVQSNSSSTSTSPITVGLLDVLSFHTKTLHLTFNAARGSYLNTTMHLGWPFVKGFNSNSLIQQSCNKSRLLFHNNNTIS